MATTLVKGMVRGLFVGGTPGRSQGTMLVCVRLKMNSSMTRSVPMVREMRERDVEGGLEWMKWWV
jgi:hypothetical protein